MDFPEHTCLNMVFACLMACITNCKVHQSKYIGCKNGSDGPLAKCRTPLAIPSWRCASWCLPACSASCPATASWTSLSCAGRYFPCLTLMQCKSLCLAVHHNFIGAVRTVLLGMQSTRKCPETEFCSPSGCSVRGKEVVYYLITQILLSID